MMEAYAALREMVASSVEIDAHLSKSDVWLIKKPIAGYQTIRMSQPRYGAVIALPTTGHLVSVASLVGPQWCTWVALPPEKSIELAEYVPECQKAIFVLAQWSIPCSSG